MRFNVLLPKDLVSQSEKPENATPLQPQLVIRKKNIFVLSF